MTVNNKLDIDFPSLDSRAVSQAIVDNYLEKKGITILIMNLRISSIVTFDPIKEEWRDRDEVIDTTRDTELIPYAITKIFHNFAMTCSCLEDYAYSFSSRIDKVAHAYILAMLPIQRKQQIAQLEEDLISLELQQKKASTLVKEAQAIVVDKDLIIMKEQVLDNKNRILALEKILNDLTAFGTLWTLFKGSREERRIELIAILKEQNVYANELKDGECVRLTLVMVKARLKNLAEEKLELGQAISARENQNRQTHKDLELTALRNYSEISNRVTDIRNQLETLKKSTVGEV